MKPIPLTDKHKEKLLEMCRKLFSEDVWSFNNDEGDSSGILDRNLFADSLSGKQLTWNDEGSHFHWFEFCMTYLVAAIGNADRTNAKEFYDETDMRGEMCLRYEWYIKEAYHPVDFLYEQFKKIK